jgi:hypothetical protein
MQDTEQMLLNEYRALDRKIAANKAKLEKLKERFKKQKGTLLDRRPLRYSTEFNFVPGSLQSQTETFTVAGGTDFFCTQLSSSVRVVGESQAASGAPPIPGQAVNLTRPFGQGQPSYGAFRNEIFDYDWRVLDTSEDREWQNIQQPSVFMGSGSLSGMDLPCPARMRGGSKILVEVDPHVSIPFQNEDFGLYYSISRIVLHVSFFGFEVRK